MSIQEQISINKRKLEERKVLKIFSKVLKSFGITKNFRSFEEIKKFLIEKKGDYNQNFEKGFVRLLEYVESVLNNFTIFQSILDRYNTLYFGSANDKYLKFSNFGSLPRIYLQLIENLKINEKFIRLLKEVKLEEKEILVTQIFLNYTLQVYLGEFRKREKFYNTSKRTPAGWHFVKVVENLAWFYLLLQEFEKENKLNKELLNFKKFFEREKFILFISAVFHDIVEDKRLTLPINFVLGNLIDVFPERLPPNVIFDDIKENILNAFFVNKFKKFVNCLHGFNFENFIEEKLKTGNLKLKEEQLIELNLYNLKILLKFLLMRLGGVRIITKNELILLSSQQIKNILEIVDYLTQRRHGFFYLSKNRKYRYIKKFLDRLEKSPEAVIVKRADLLDNLSSSLSEKQIEKYSKYYILFFKRIFNVDNYYLKKLIPDNVTNKEIILKNLKMLENFNVS